MRAKVGFEEVEGRECIIVSEIPYQVNKADMIKRTADLVNDKKLKELQIFVMNQIEWYAYRLSLKRYTKRGFNTLYKYTNCSLHLVSIILHW
jgi:DNA gyrase subunit A